MNPLLVALNASYVHTNLAVRLLRDSTKRPVGLLEMTINDRKTSCCRKSFGSSPM